MGAFGGQRPKKQPILQAKIGYFIQGKQAKQAEIGSVPQAKAYNRPTIGRLICLADNIQPM